MSNTCYEADVEKILISEEEIQSAVERIGAEINETYKDSKKTLLLVGILKGSVVFMADLMKHIDRPTAIDFMQASSYGTSTVSCGQVNLRLDLKTADLENYDVLVIEDILDSGRTLSCIMSYLSARGAKSVKLCTLLNKPERRQVEIDVDFNGFNVPDEFVVGYGLDYDEKYRNMPYIGVLKPSVYEK